MYFIFETLTRFGGIFVSIIDHTTKLDSVCISLSEKYIVFKLSLKRAPTIIVGGKNLNAGRPSEMPVGQKFLILFTPANFTTFFKIYKNFYYIVSCSRPTLQCGERK